MSASNDFRRGRHVLSRLHVHLVFTPKYRRGVISQKVFDVLQQAWQVVCADFECELLESNYELDHVHLLIEYPPKVALARLVNSLKGVSARRLRALRLPEVRQKLWGKHFWSPSYCAISCGGASLEIIRKYVEQQRGEGMSSVRAAHPRP